MKNKILIVDDDIKILESLKKKIETKYNVVTVRNAEEALKIFNEDNNYAVVISDMKMPGMDGIEFLEKIKEKDPLTIRILITGYADLETAINAVNKGKIFHFLSKPFTKEVLLKVIEIGLETYKKQLKLQQESITDELTGLFNRRFFLSKLEEEFINAEREKIDFCIIFIDINNFKEINDNYGHDIGDRALIILSNLLKRICRNNDISARFGGDEFIILANFTNKAGAEILINRIRDLLNKEIIDNTDITISIAAGISGYPDDGKEIETLINIADQEMYKNKKEMKKTLNNN